MAFAGAPLAAAAVAHSPALPSCGVDVQQGRYVLRIIVPLAHDCCSVGDRVYFYHSDGSSREMEVLGIHRREFAAEYKLGSLIQPE